MSSIIILLSPEQAIVATDTLAVNLDGSPRQFTTKAFLLPHLKTIVAGTGLAGLASAWFRRVNEMMLVRSLDHLNFHTQQGLCELYGRDFGEIDGHEVSSSIYQIGVGDDGRMHGYSYSSFYDFEPRRMEYGLQMKPTAGPETEDSQRTIAQLMLAQRNLQDKEPASARVYIGGDINLIKLELDGTAIHTSLDRFPDYQEAEAAMYKGFGAA
ncbi:hypothetical protein [Stutzerimonas zhaodongensis]|jgi:hypothetical protein|uniref:Proteasome subunit alpha n=1 Tax=Stutzerimonas zhaodongensis TaxID=1176257 RepID=A0A365PWF6_9GAMM|nr:hypothetical protein [Stutzerimonas zhaodongensis]QWV18034.1 hypothetical protein KQ248_04950 [Stutzerimonas zhaodongensis]RBA59902.1 hypothetical protein DQ403_08065 [Stutzerimonas zhaodongensis]